MLLTLAIFLPFLGMILILRAKGDDEKARNLGLVFSIVTFVLCSIVAYKTYGLESGKYAAEIDVSWIELGDSFHVRYHIGVDGLSGMLIFLTGLLAICAALASWGIKKNVRGYWAMFLLLHTGVIGTFASLDTFLFYMFWELMLLPMYFLIGIWGGPRRIYAAIKFFLYTLWGSVFLLAGILVVYFALSADKLPDEITAKNPQALTFSAWRAANPDSLNGADANVFSIPQVTAYAKYMVGKGGILAAFGDLSLFGHHIAWWIFWGMFIAFAVKVPVFPFHTWLPDAHVEAPTPISVILAGILLKLGGYGMLRLNFPFFPQVFAEAAFCLGVLGVVSIVYGALVAMAQTDFKKMVAYSSVSHMGFCILGFASLTTEGINGAVVQLFNHGTISGLLFLVVGVLYDRAHHRDLNRFGGVMWKMPVYSTMATIAIFASIGLPGLSGFWGEFLAFVGSFSGHYHHAKIITVIATSGLVFTAAYYLRAIQRVYLGKVNPACEDFPEITKREKWSMLPLLVPTILFGVYPKPLFDMISTSLNTLVETVKQTGLAG